MKKNTGFSILSRSEEIQDASKQDFDLIIIGGGVTGCGIALDATSRGLKTLLVEKADYASGTSSKSTKLIHGGLRYLKQLEIGLVRETGTERSIVHKLAPHLVHPEKMLLPIVDGGTFNKWSASLAITVYDMLAGVESKDRKKSFGKEATLQEEPLLDTNIVKSSIQYSEYRTDDARLTIELIKKAVDLGCTAFNYCIVTNLCYHEGKIVGVECQEGTTKTKVTFKAKLVVSAAGPWVDVIREIDKSRTGKSLRLTKGVHIVVSKNRMPIKHAVYFDAFDGRMLFAIPRGETTYIGTSDTDYKGHRDHVVCKQDDVNYLLLATNRLFPTLKLSNEDVVSSWAGLRPLIHEDGKTPSEVSRKDEIFISPSGLISIAGGKLTGYRKMGQRVVDLVIKKIGKPKMQCQTKNIQLTNDPFFNYGEVRRYINTMASDLGYPVSWYLVTIYGKAAQNIIQHAESIPSASRRQSILLAEIDYTIENESATNPCDFFDRRTGNIYFNIDLVISTKELCLSRFSDQLSWSDAERQVQAQKLDQMIQSAQIFK